MRCGVDTGGTFTDLVGEDGRTAKVLSTPEAPARAVAAGLGELAGPGRPAVVAHGTTVATNALLERRGARVALFTNAGLTDVIEIGRQDRPSLYDPFADRPEPLVARRDRLEVVGRLDAAGHELVAVDLGSLPAVPPGVDAVAVCLLHADLVPIHEKTVAAALAAAGASDVTCSHQVAPEFREYERTVTTVVNAYLRPLCRAYVRSLEELADEVLVMTSAGGLVPAAEAADLPVALVLSGPAGGVLAGAAAASAAGFPDAVTFDMGGTSTDVCLVQGGVPEPAPGRLAAGFPLRLPALDIHTIGAGGGSIARIDPGGALAVGPQSAGADPGPACYGRGGTDATVTDADLVLGRVPAGAAFAGLGRLDVAAAERALARAGVTASGVVDVVDASMERAVRRVTVERGVDPTGLALVAFGGAGPLHACAVAAALGMRAVVVPPRAGVLSAVGLLGGPRQRDLVRTWPTPDDHTGLDDALADLAHQAAAAVSADEPAGPGPAGGAGDGPAGGAGDGPVGGAGDGPAGGGGAVVTTALDCRYRGQSHEITVGTVGDFAEAHRRRNGYSRPGAPVEVVALRASARLAAPHPVGDLPPPPPGPEGRRRPLVGPAVVAEADCTVWVPEGWQAAVAPDGSWVLTRIRDAAR